MSGLTTRIAMFAAALGLTAALSVQPQGAEAAQERECFNADTVSGFSAYDDDRIYVRVSRKKVYELEVMGPCPNVDWTQSIGLDSRTGFVCTGMDVDLVVPQDGFGGAIRCSVRTVRRLSEEEALNLGKDR